MNAISWLIFTCVVLAGIGALAWRKPARRGFTKQDSIAWDGAAGVGILTLMWVAGTMIDMLPSVTVIDIGAVIATAMIASLLLGVSVSRRVQRHRN